MSRVGTEPAGAAAVAPAATPCRRAGREAVDGMSGGGRGGIDVCEWTAKRRIKKYVYLRFGVKPAQSKGCGSQRGGQREGTGVQ